MTHIHNGADGFAAAALDGFCDVYARLVQRIRSGVMRATATPDGKVAVVIGGGSGHYPAFAGYVGPGLADAAVAGDIFASPSAKAVYDVCKRADRGGGVLLMFGNYAGDVLNFNIAAERLRREGIDTRIVAITDDIASAREPARRRGIAGDLLVLKLAAAAAEAGQTLDQVTRIARHANDRTRSFGVAFGGCTLPGATTPLFDVPAGHMALGLGIHGEPGIDEVAILKAGDLATLLVGRLLDDMPAGAGTHVAAVLNGLGGTKQEELFVLWTSIAAGLRNAGLKSVGPEVGEFITSLDMEGCSLSLTWLDDTLEPLWTAPCESAALTRGQTIPTTPAPLVQEAADQAVIWAPATAASRTAGQAVAEAMDLLAATLDGAEAELGQIDARAGDGDHGRGMACGSAAGARAARAAATAGAGAGDVLTAAADAWAHRAGGTSGALWGLGLQSAGQAIGNEASPSAADVAHAARTALDAVMRLGGARLGDKTLVDALTPFVETLERESAGGAGLDRSWHAAVQAAASAADRTADLLPRIGRARPLAARSKGYPDAGAISLALCARAILKMMEHENV
jgi:D-erythrulose 4-kinase